MQTLQIILFILSTIAYLVAFGFVAYAVTRLQHLEHRADNISERIDNLTSVALSQFLQGQVEALTTLTMSYNDAVQQENYEEAGKLKNLIDEQKKRLKNNMDYFKKSFAGQDMPNLVDLKKGELML